MKSEKPKNTRIKLSLEASERLLKMLKTIVNSD